MFGHLCFPEKWTGPVKESYGWLVSKIDLKIMDVYFQDVLLISFTISLDM
jgi:hypothetical protein